MNEVIRPAEAAGLPDLLTFLEARYREAILAQNAQLRDAAEGRPAPQIDLDEALDVVGRFCQFGRRYLAEHRPAQLFHSAANYGVVLANGQTVLLAPAMPGEGAMARSDHYMVTGRRHAGELHVERSPAEDRDAARS